MLCQADVDTDSIGNVVCRKVDELRAGALIMASHSKSKLQVSVPTCCLMRADVTCVPVHENACTFMG